MLLWLGLSTIASVALGHGRELIDDRWQPSATALALHSTEAEAAPRRTIMQCLGTTTLTRACHFENVYYNVSAKRFVYFGPERATPEKFGAGVRGEPWLRLIRGRFPWKKQEAKTQFHMDWRGGEPLPPAEEVATYSQPLHLRAVLYTKSLGHLLRDNLMALVDLPLRFGRDPVDFDWVRWESDLSRSSWQTESATAVHYRGLLNNRPSVTWQQVLDEALAGLGGRPGVQYIQFSELIGGEGPSDMFTQVGQMKIVPSTATLLEWAQMCSPFPFAQMREVAYRNHGLTVASARALEPFVLFLEGQPGEKRHLHNADELLPTLMDKFPGVRMEHVQISRLDLQEQLELLSKATVIVSNIGSRSFRLIYLPNGASVILVGPPEFAFQVPPKKRNGPPKTERGVPMPFQEIDSCWGYLGYVNLLQYHVTTEEEVFRNKAWNTWRDARDTDIILDERQLSDLLQIALQRAASAKTFRGAGTLAAYMYT